MASMVRGINCVHDGGSCGQRGNNMPIGELFYSRIFSFLVWVLVNMGDRWRAVVGINNFFVCCLLYRMVSIPIFGGAAL